MGPSAHACMLQAQDLLAYLAQESHVDLHHVCSGAVANGAPLRLVQGALMH